MLLKTIAVILFSFETRPFSQHVNAQKTNRLGSNSVSVLKDSKAGNKTSHIWWATGAIRPGVFPQRNVPGSFPVCGRRTFVQRNMWASHLSTTGLKVRVDSTLSCPKIAQELVPMRWFGKILDMFFFSKKKQEHSKICLRLFLCIGKLLSEQQKLQVFRGNFDFPKIWMMTWVSLQGRAVRIGHLCIGTKIQGGSKAPRLHNFLKNNDRFLLEVGRSLILRHTTTILELFWLMWVM